MTQSIIALTGISGVGKSSLLRRFAKGHAFQHLIASDLIAGQARHDPRASNIGETLRRANIDDNQVSLVTGFHQMRDPNTACIILDGHIVIDAPNGFVPIEPAVFAEIGISRLVMLIDDPALISARRQAGH